MITDDQLYSLAVFLGCLAMLLIVLYHFLEVNAIEDDAQSTDVGKAESRQAIRGNEKGQGAVMAEGR